MKTIDATKSGLTVRELLELARRENVVLEASGGQKFILAELDDFDREIELVRQNSELLAFLDERSNAPGRISHEQLKRELGVD